ncbi:putative mitochondrial processing peptidase alpha subunit [Ixodes scapularis]
MPPGSLVQGRLMADAAVVQASVRSVYLLTSNTAHCPMGQRITIALPCPVRSTSIRQGSAAYTDNTLGLPKLCPRENLGVVNREVLYTFLSHHYVPQRMVVAGVGVEHGPLVEMVHRHFVEKAPLWKENPELILDNKMEPDNSIAQYTGGIVKVPKDLSKVSPGQTPIPDLAHFVLGLESCSHQDPDFIAFCVLNMIMGGGGSFSAGGPGKGMYTRLYTNVLNRDPVASCGPEIQFGPGTSEKEKVGCQGRSVFESRWHSKYQGQRQRQRKALDKMQYKIQHLQNQPSAPPSRQSCEGQPEKGSL